jgi:hypothetical protein
MLSSGYPTDLLEAHIKGVAEALKNLTEAGASDPVVKATVSLSESGFASIQDAVAFGEIKDDSLTGKLKGLFGAGSSSSSSETESEHETVARSEAPEESATAASSNSSKEKEKAAVKDTIQLEVEVKLASIPPMTVAEKRAARDRCVQICLMLVVVADMLLTGCAPSICPNRPSAARKRLETRWKATCIVSGTFFRKRERRRSGSARRRKNAVPWATSLRRRLLGCMITTTRRLMNTLSSDHR